MTKSIWAQLAVLALGFLWRKFLSAKKAQEVAVKNDRLKEDPSEASLADLTRDGL